MDVVSLRPVCRCRGGEGVVAVDVVDVVSLRRLQPVSRRNSLKWCRSVRGEAGAARRREAGRRAFIRRQHLELRCRRSGYSSGNLNLHAA